MFRLVLIFALIHAVLTGHHSAGAPMLICSGGAMAVKLVGTDGDTPSPQPCGPCCLMAMTADLPPLPAPDRPQISVNRAGHVAASVGWNIPRAATARGPPMA